MAQTGSGFNDLSGSRVATPPGDDQISWSRRLGQMVERGARLSVDDGAFVRATYRPFTKAWLYFSRDLIDEPGQTRFLWLQERPNQMVYLTAPGGSSSFFLDSVPDLTMPGAGNPGQIFARWRYEPFEEEDALDFEGGGVVGGYRRSTTSLTRRCRGSRWSRICGRSSRPGVGSQAALGLRIGDAVPARRSRHCTSGRRRLVRLPSNAEDDVRQSSRRRDQ